MNIMKLIGVLLLILVLMQVPSVQALTVQTQEQKQALAIQEALFNRGYSSALHLLDSMELAPDSPLPALVRMTMLQLNMSESFSFNRNQEFLRHALSHEAVCDEQTNNSKAEVWPMMLCGAGDGLQALYYIKNNQSFKAIHYARKAIKLFEQVKQKDPANIDADLAAAVYDYFKSEFTETKLAFVPFLKDKREASLKQIQNVSRNGTFARHLADLALALIAVETNQKVLGDDVFKRLSSKFPSSVLFKIMNAAFLINTKDYNGALGVLAKLERYAPTLPVIKYFKARALTLQGEDLLTATNCLNDVVKVKADKSIQGPSYYLLGVIAEREGRLDEAIDYYQKAYDIYPQYKNSLKSLLRLKRQRET